MPMKEINNIKEAISYMPNPFWQSIPFRQWLKTQEYLITQQLPNWFYVSLWFNRMPSRLAYQRTNWIVSPVDGVVIHAGRYNPDRDVLDVKGKSYTINQVLERDMKCSCYCIGIFLTAFSVHLVRSPVTGRITKTQTLPYLLTTNMCMVVAEDLLFSKQRIKPESYDFVFKNERKIIEFYDTQNRQDIILVSIADRDVNAIIDYVSEQDVVRKGQGLQFVNWGSYALLVIPENRRKLDIKMCVKPLDYVFAGLTRICEIF